MTEETEEDEEDEFIPLERINKDSSLHSESDREEEMFNLAENGFINSSSSDEEGTESGDESDEQVGYFTIYINELLCMRMTKTLDIN